MEKSWFNSMLSKGELEYRYKCGLSKSMDSLGPIENTSISEDQVINDNDTDKNIHGWGESSSYYSNVDHLVGAEDIRNFISDDTFLVRDTNRDSYSIYFDIENKNVEIDNEQAFLSELETFFYSYPNYSYMKNRSKSDDPHYDPYMYKYSWNNHINSCIDSYLRSQICIDSYIFSGCDDYSYIYNYICGESGTSNERQNSNIQISTNDSDFTIQENSDFTIQENSDFTIQENSDFTIQENSDFTIQENPDFTIQENSDFTIQENLDFTIQENSDFTIQENSDFTIQENPDFTIQENPDFTIQENSNDLDITPKYKHLWVQCEDCYALNYKKILKSNMYVCEQCGYHLKMGSSDRIEFSIDPGTWHPMNEDMVSLDPIEFHSEEEPYKDRIYSYQRKTGLPEAVQTGTGQLNGIPIALGAMDFQFMGGSMGSVVGEKITRLIEYATKNFLPLILVCASGGARMQEGSLSLMQMAKISSALYDYQSNKKLFYVSILASPTTGGVTASFGMLGDIIIAEPNAYIAFAGKRVIEQTLNKTVPEGSQVAEYLFDKGLFDAIVPRNLLKGVLSELFQLHTFFPNSNKIEIEQSS